MYISVFISLPRLITVDASLVDTFGLFCQQNCADIEEYSPVFTLFPWTGVSQYVPIVSLPLGSISSSVCYSINQYFIRLNDFPICTHNTGHYLFIHILARLSF